jgi:outer membrane receptor protein involved in Fe transport
MKAISLIGAGVATALFGVAAQADDQASGGARPASSGLEEIVVTANRREQNLQEVGLSIAAFTGEQLQRLQVITAADIAAITPNVDLVRSYAGPGFNTQITIRGVGQPDFSDTTEATATTYVDEFYMIGAGQADFLLFDLDRVEVARGPQGTVQGRNSTAGSINYYTRAPELDDVSGQASLSLGQYNLVRTNGYLNLPLGDTVAMRASFATDYNHGYVKNINPQRLFDRGGNSDFMAGRLQFLFEPSDSFRLNIKGEYGQSGPIASNEEGIQTGVIPGRVGTFRVPLDAFGQSEQNIGAGAKSERAERENGSHPRPGRLDHERRLDHGRPGRLPAVGQGRGRDLRPHAEADMPFLEQGRVDAHDAGTEDQLRLRRRHPPDGRRQLPRPQHRLPLGDAAVLLSRADLRGVRACRHGHVHADLPRPAGPHQLGGVRPGRVGFRGSLDPDRRHPLHR